MRSGIAAESSFTLLSQLKSASASASASLPNAFIPCVPDENSLRHHCRLPFYFVFSVKNVTGFEKNPPRRVCERNARTPCLPSFKRKGRELGHMASDTPMHHRRWAGGLSATASCAYGLLRILPSGTYFVTSSLLPPYLRYFLS